MESWKTFLHSRLQRGLSGFRAAALCVMLYSDKINIKGRCVSTIRMNLVCCLCFVQIDMLIAGVGAPRLGHLFTSFTGSRIGKQYHH